MAAIHATVIMQLVNDDIFKILECFRPFRMMRQDAGMHHVRIGEDHVCAFADGFARVLWSVAVVSERLDRRTCGVDNRLEFVQLVFRQSLGREHIKGAGIGIRKNLIEHRQVVAERLAAGGWCHDGDVATGLGDGKRLVLVGVKLVDPAFMQRPYQRGVDG